jgi:hypothetical protein
MPVSSKTRQLHEGNDTMGDDYSSLPSSGNTYGCRISQWKLRRMLRRYRGNEDRQRNEPEALGKIRLNAAAIHTGMYGILPKETLTLIVLEIAENPSRSTWLLRGVIVDASIERTNLFEPASGGEYEYNPRNRTATKTVSNWSPARTRTIGDIEDLIRKLR